MSRQISGFDFHIIHSTGTRVLKKGKNLNHRLTDLNINKLQNAVSSPEIALTFTQGIFY
jgi:hypothetical protein